MSFSSILFLLCLIISITIIVTLIKRYGFIKCLGIFTIIIIFFGFSIFIYFFLKVDRTPIIEGYITDIDKNKPIPNTIVKCCWLGRVIETRTILDELCVFTDKNGYYLIPEKEIKTSFKKGSLNSIVLEYFHPLYSLKREVVSDSTYSKKIKIKGLLKLKRYTIDIKLDEISKKGCRQIVQDLDTFITYYFNWGIKTKFKFDEDYIWQEWDYILSKACTQIDYEKNIQFLRRKYERYKKNLEVE